MSAIPSTEGVDALLEAAVADVRGRAPRPGCSVGVDIVESARLARLLDKAGERLAARLYTTTERLFCGADDERLASTLAGKEAVAKALGTGVRLGVRWTDIEILREPGGRPYTSLHGQAAEQAAGLGLADIIISLGHEDGLAFAVAIGVSEEVAA